MAALFGVPPAEVMQRLAWDPALAPLAIQAARSGQSRRSAGSTLTVIGLIAAGMGAMLWAEHKPDDSDVSCGTDAECHSWDTFDKGGQLLVAMGVTLAIPGFALLATTTTSEDEAVRRYRQLEPVRPSPPRPLATGPSSGSPAKAFQVQLLSLRF
jgi:hypothetical protein